MKKNFKYGIDLGTTNSAICKIDEGKASLIKVDGSFDTMPSVVNFTKKKITKVGLVASNALRSELANLLKKDSIENINTSSKVISNIFYEFKRSMGLDTEFYSPNMENSFSAENLSAQVLKTLKSYCQDENVEACVITIPAKFKADQIAATKRAANEAGITYCELLQEPIAASIAYGIDSNKKDGNWLVFDFGGGTFDIALLKVQDGIMQVADIDGDNYLGGKNLAEAIVDNFIIPKIEEEYTIDDIKNNFTKFNLFRDLLKMIAENGKNELTFKEKTDITSQIEELGEDDFGESIELDLTFTREDYEDIARPIFQRAIDITKNLMDKHNLSKSTIDSLILVGGPTHTPLLRQMLKEQITNNVMTNIDPMTAVAVGAAIYANTTTYESDEEIKESGVVVLDLNYDTNTVDESSFVSVRIDSDKSTESCSDINVELIRSDNAWKSGSTSINTEGDVIELFLNEHTTNAFKIKAFNRKGNAVKVYPDNITIVHGNRISKAVLPYHIGIEVLNKKQDRDVFVSLDGLEKNVNLPATGRKKNLRSPYINKNNKNDKLIIPIYQGEIDAVNKSSLCSDHVFDVEVLSKELTQDIEKDSLVDIEINIDQSQLMTLKVHFIETDQVIVKSIDVKAREAASEDDVDNLLNEFDKKMELFDVDIESEKHSKQIIEANNLIQNVRERKDNESLSQDGRMHLVSDVRRALLSIDSVAIEKEIQSIIDMLEDFFEKFNDLIDDGLVPPRKADLLHNIEGEYRSKKEEAKKNKDISFFHSIQSIIYTTILNEDELNIGTIVKHLSSEFHNIKWKNPQRARQILNELQYSIENNEYIDHSKVEELLSYILDNSQKLHI